MPLPHFAFPLEAHCGPESSVRPHLAAVSSAAVSVVWDPSCAAVSPFPAASFGVVPVAFWEPCEGRGHVTAEGLAEITIPHRPQGWKTAG